MSKVVLILVQLPFHSSFASLSPKLRNALGKGDVVVFKSYISWPDEKLLVHRVTDIRKDDVTGNLMLETKGDADEWMDW